MTSPQVIDTDIERALQHAIGQANRVFTIGVPSSDVHADPSCKTGKKRKKGAKDMIEDGGLEKDKKRKKRKTSSHSYGEPNPSTNETLGHHDETAKKRTDAKAHPESSLLAGNHVPASQTTQELYYHPGLPPFPGAHSEDNSSSQLNTNDDILRAFQVLDLTRLAGVLQGLDLPSSPVQANVQLDDASQGDAAVSFSDQTFSTVLNTDIASSSAIVGPSGDSPAPPMPSKKQKRKASKSTLQPSPNLMTVGPSIASPEHTHLLATKWLSSSKLKALTETEGLVYKKGKFSAIEEQALRTAIEDYRVGHGLSTEQLTEIIFSKSKEENGFWSEITASVPARPITAVYHHVHRVCHPLKYQGKWVEEEDVALIQAVADHGQAWQKVSERVGRMPQDCRDRWKNHLAHRSERQRGHWTKEEEEELTRIVLELTTKQGKDSDNDIFWGVVSQRMGNKRGRQQCRLKWTDSLSKTVKNSGNAPRWSKLDSYILVHKVASLDVRDDSEIDWNILPDEDWNLWSAHSMQRRWRSLKLSIKGHELMAFREIVEILQQKHSQLPSIREASPTRKKGYMRKEPKSAELIEEDEEGSAAG